MESKPHIVHLLVLMFVIPAFCGRDPEQEKEVEDLPINRGGTPPAYLNLPPTDSMEEENGPPLIASAISWYQRRIVSYPKLFLQVHKKTSLPSFVFRGIQLDQNVYMITETTSDGFPDYVNRIHGVLARLEGG